MLPAKQHSAVLRQLRRDLELLERLHVIDYSLLLGMHFLRWGNATWHPPFADWPAEPAAAAAADGSSRGSVEDSAPASPLATRASEAAEAALAGLGAARSVTAALRPAVDSVQSAASAAAVGAQPGELNGSAYPAAPAEPMPRRLPSRLHRSTSIDAANSLAALIAANVQAARPEVQPEWQAGQRTQQPVPAAREQGPATDEVPAGQHPDASAAAAAILMQAANQSRAQARLSARAALQAACNGDDGTADAAGPLAVAGVPPLPPLPPIAEAAEAGCHSSGRALQHSTSSSTGSSLLTGASTLSTRGSSGSSDLSDETGMRGPAGGDLASKLQVAAEAALSLNGGPAAALRRMQSAPEARPKEEPLATGAWWPGLTCGLGAGAVCLGSEEQGECWARPPPQPALPLSPRELAAGMGVQQGREAQHAQQAEQRQQAEAGPRLLPDSRAGSGSLGGSSLGSPQGSSVGAAAGHRVAAPAAACAALQQQQQQLGRLLSLRSDGGEPGSSGRAVPAVAIRRGSGGQLQCEPVLLFFGIIDFLQVMGAGGRAWPLHMRSMSDRRGVADTRFCLRMCNSQRLLPGRHECQLTHAHTACPASGLHAAQAPGALVQGCSVGRPSSQRGGTQLLLPPLSGSHTACAHKQRRCGGRARVPRVRRGQRRQGAGIGGEAPAWLSPHPAVQCDPSARFATNVPFCNRDRHAEPCVISVRKAPEKGKNSKMEDGDVCCAAYEHLHYTDSCCSANIEVAAFHPRVPAARAALGRHVGTAPGPVLGDAPTAAERACR